MKEDLAETKRNYRPGIMVLAWLGGILSIFVVLGVIGALVMGFHHPTARLSVAKGMEFSQARGPVAYGTFRRGMPPVSQANTNEQALTGVVTAVNGSTVTIAGGGESNTVTTTSSTTYGNDTKPAVNDTVVAFGTTNNGAFTATEIDVR